MKLIPETIYRVVNDDGTEVHSATAQKVNDIVQLMKDAKILGDSSPVNNTVGMRIASAILSTYELRKKRTVSVGNVAPDKLVETETAYVNMEDFKLKDTQTQDTGYENNECPDCGNDIPSDGNECKNCGHVFITE